MGRDDRYLEVEVNQNNAQYCAIIENKDGKGDITIDLLSKNPVKSAVIVSDKTWICDIMIPMEELTALGFDKSDARFNAHRQDFAEDGTLRLSSLSPGYAETFHIADAFLKVRFAH